MRVGAYLVVPYPPSVLVFASARTRLFSDPCYTDNNAHLTRSPTFTNPATSLLHTPLLPLQTHPPTQAFMKLSLIREKFEDLVRVVEETGRLENDGRDLENRSEQLRARNTALNTERVVKDLRQVKEENAGLKARLKAL